MTRPNAARRQIVILILARPFDRLFWIGSIAKPPSRHLLSSGFTDLLVQARLRSFRQLQSFCALHLNPLRILGAAFSFLEERKGAIKAVFSSQQSHINSL